MIGEHAGETTLSAGRRAGIGQGTKDDFMAWLRSLTRKQMHGPEKREDIPAEMDMYANDICCLTSRREKKRKQEDRVCEVLTNISRDWTYLLKTDYIRRGDLLDRVSMPAQRKKLMARGLWCAAVYLATYDKWYGAAHFHAPPKAWKYATA